MVRHTVTAGTAILLAISLTACTQAAPPAPSPSATNTPAPTPTRTITPTPTPTPPPTVWPSGAVSTIVTNLDAPWGIAQARVFTFVSERDTGRILAITDGGVVSEIATLTDVQHGGEGGLLGLAADDEALYAYSTGGDGNRVQRFPLTGTATAPALGESSTLLSGLPSARNHNGGQLAFGPDGMLYVSVGDAGDPDAAQDPSSLAGKILRLMPSGAVPGDNPFPGSFVYSLGHRNVQGIAWSADGRMFASEFGQDTWDELNEILPGANYGWPVVEGAGGDARFIDPLRQWPTDQASPSGLVAIEGSLILANLRGQSIRVVPVSDPASEQTFFLGEFGRIRAVAPATQGVLWFLTNNTDGRGSPGADDDRLLAVVLAPG